MCYSQKVRLMILMKQLDKILHANADDMLLDTIDSLRYEIDMIRRNALAVTPVRA